MSNVLRVGGVCRHGGDAAQATQQLLAAGQVDVLVYDYLTETSMAIQAQARRQDPKAGFFVEFLNDALLPHLKQIATQRVKVIANAGGANPEACAAMVMQAVKQAGLALQVAAISGDDLMPELDKIAKRAPLDLDSKAEFPPAERITSLNAQLGAAPVVAALDEGADIIITGCCAASALTLGAAMQHFGWEPRDLHYLAGGGLAGHVLAGGVQACGGNFTDWEEVAGDIASLGAPIVEILADGSFVMTKPEGTGGLVSPGTVGEQLLGGIAEPTAYALADVICDVTALQLEEIGPDRVRLRGARGLPPPERYKISGTWRDGFRIGQYLTFYGLDAEQKAEHFAAAVLHRAAEGVAARKLAPFAETSVEVLGGESQFGALRASDVAREVVLKIAVRHPEASGTMVFMKALMALEQAAPPGLCGCAGLRPRPAPVLASFSYLTPKSEVPLSLRIGNAPPRKLLEPAPSLPRDTVKTVAPPDPPRAPMAKGPTVSMPLSRVAFARSCDLGDMVALGVIARHPEQLPWIWSGLTQLHLQEVFGHFMKKGARIRRYPVPGLHAMTITISGALGGGGCRSLRNDPQGRGFAQLVLAAPILMDWSLLSSARQ
ncbi:acyclic terpene utilization AtuA family protein [Phaeobacter sp. HF9A]|uniref:acyclic terpene utilization AtuA family protein n=1 Tax=Phaeobacter sp. HF9A TaxID=2721561 RepID=UPI001430B55F|nr:acyclic terpene utilization AtuA family protein [Phaeobacter sp. HF9A]NIZ12858.1 acyclic terpene utilization AtuA family protein [Phaeobacter sp. HF9A]